MVNARPIPAADLPLHFQVHADAAPGDVLGALAELLIDAVERQVGDQGGDGQQVADAQQDVGMGGNRST